MREAIGGTWITQLVIVIMFVFVAFLALSINYSKAFRVKNEVISMIEKKEGISNSSIKLINNYLKNSGYGYEGNCEEGYIGVSISNNNNGTYEDAVANKRYNYCIKKVKSIAINFPNRAYYEVILFFKFNLPVVGDIFTFEVEGQTKDIEYPIDSPAGSNINTSVTPSNPGSSDTPTDPNTPTGGTTNTPSGGTSTTPSGTNSGGTTTPSTPSNSGTTNNSGNVQTTPTTPSTPSTPTTPSTPSSGGGTTQNSNDLGLSDEKVIYLNAKNNTVILTATSDVNWEIDNNEKLDKVEVKSKSIKLKAKKTGNTKVCATTKSGNKDCTNVKVKKKVIIVIGASQVTRMKNYVTSYSSNKYNYKTSNNTLIFVNKGGSGISYQLGNGFNTAKSNIKSKNYADYYVIFPLPGNEIRDFTCNQITTSNTTIKGYASGFNSKITSLKNEGYNVNGYVISVHPVEPSNPNAGDKVVKNSNKHACDKNYRSNKKYYKFNQTMSSLVSSQPNITYVETFTQIMDIQGNVNGTYKYKITYNTDDGVHWDEKTTKSYVKIMFNSVNGI